MDMIVIDTVTADTLIAGDCILAYSDESESGLTYDCVRSVEDNGNSILITFEDSEDIELSPDQSVDLYGYEDSPDDI